jgi:hypothetical protein
VRDLVIGMSDGLTVPFALFENVRCVRCEHPLAYLPDLKVVESLEPAGGDLWHSPLPQVLTGHRNGVITIHVAEADDVEREQRRHQMHEPYRTLLGHFRHESGHYYWDRLLQHSPRLAAFRLVFGDERADYSEALTWHYQRGAPTDWPQRFISAYASAHPWEDWAETWAHYLHMTDALETAVACGLSLQPLRPDEPSLPPTVRGDRLGAFGQMLTAWFSLIYVLNNLNRSLGLPDSYPFILSTPAIDKLRFIHETIAAASHAVC